MANKTIYVRDEIAWAAFKAYADNRKTSMSQLLEDYIKQLMGTRRKRILQAIRCEGR